MKKKKQNETSSRITNELTDLALGLSGSISPKVQLAEAGTAAEFNLMGSSENHCSIQLASDEIPLLTLIVSSGSIRLASDSEWSQQANDSAFAFSWGDYLVQLTLGSRINGGIAIFGTVSTIHK